MELILFIVVNKYQLLYRTLHREMIGTIFMKSFFKFHQPHVAPKGVILAGIGGFLAIGILNYLSQSANAALVMAPFGATCVLLFSVYGSPLSQPVNVVGGHVLSAAVGFAGLWLLPDAWWAVAIAVGTAVSLMALFRVTHPPAGANPLVIFALEPSIEFMLFPVLSGAILLVIIATIYHRATGISYPLKAG